jgi:hypothetical protein
VNLTKLLTINGSQKTDKTAKRIAVIFSIMMLILSFMALTGETYLAFHTPIADAQTSTCPQLTVGSSSITASGFDSPTPPANVIDNNLSTRWSNNAIGSWIRFDLGSIKSICQVDIAWYRGNVRQNNFIISVSTGGTTFQDVLSRKSSGTTVNPEPYDIPDTNARYLRITVNGNTENNWASITEVDIYGRPDTTAPTIVRTTPADLSTGVAPTSSVLATFSEAMSSASISTSTFTLRRDGTTTSIGSTVTLSTDGKTATLKPSSNLQATTKYIATITTGAKDTAGNALAANQIWSFTTGSAAVDPFGIIKIHPTKSNGEEWYINMNNPTSDPRFDPGSTITKNADGSWKITSTKIRMGVRTSTGYDQSKITTYNEKELASKGYMQASNDWRNIEMTGYVKVNSFNTDDNFAWYNRGGRHTDSVPCEGTAYKGHVFYSGKTRFAKEQWHVSYVFSPYKTATSSIEDKWIGFKYIVYNFVQNGNTVVKMQNWIDKNVDGKQDGPWEKVDERIDSGGWGTDATKCGGAPDQKITWGGPIATFRWDSATNTDFKWLSVREIRPPLS